MHQTGDRVRDLEEAIFRAATGASGRRWDFEPGRIQVGEVAFGGPPWAPTAAGRTNERSEILEGIKRSQTWASVRVLGPSVGRRKPPRSDERIGA